MPGAAGNDDYAFAADFLQLNKKAPKRCGHVAGKHVVSRDIAFARVKAACDARDGAAPAVGRAATVFQRGRDDDATATRAERSVSFVARRHIQKLR